MDRDTRFLLASRLSKLRDAVSGERALKETLANTHDNKPAKVYTDALRAYNEAVAFAFKGVEHVAKAGVGKPHATNNRAERLNRTVRERVKVQRGWKSISTPLAEGQRIHYGFVKSHQALDGQTPAQRAGIRLEGQNKWLALLKAALTTPEGTPN
ncbi:MAG: DDE-type integrase/transposase/recombinase [Nitrososphaerota archaeon]|jgi:transposase-like protein|nr:DDE-type integrase/transposase/recombinase [Nitrososphaerota archaeon]MDG6990143.1 DDE-type integrase/transposase/recombinase [Nitrososphaerota archaeon]